MAELRIKGSKTILDKIVREQRLRVSRYGLELTYDNGEKKVEVKEEVIPKKTVAKKVTQKKSSKKGKNFYGNK